MDADGTPERRERALYQKIGFWCGLVLFAALTVLPAPAGIGEAAWATVALAGLMAAWWATEAIPVPATSLLPLIMLPLLGVTTTAEASLPYGQPVIFLLLGGFIAALAMQRWNLHRRIALSILARVGDHPGALIAGFMGAAAFLSMWISNTATTLMIVPIALTVAETVLGQEARGHRFTLALLIGCAWSASIGGLGTYIGTPPNLFVKGFILESTGRDILFIEWMAFAVPVVAVMVPLAWVVLTRVCFRFRPGEVTGGGAVVQRELAKLGPMTVAEKRVTLVLLTMALLWSTRQLLVEWDWLTGLLPFMARLSDTHIAVAGGLSMFLIPAGRTVAAGGEAGSKAAEQAGTSSENDTDSQNSGGSQSGIKGQNNSGSQNNSGGALITWEEAVRLPWGVLLLFGGGLSLAGAIQSTGLAAWLGTALVGLAAAPLFLLILAIVALVIFLTELTSNTATTAALVPVLSALAASANLDPVILAAPVAMAASCAFMLPVATGPNAVVFSTGHIRVPDMMRAGLWLNVIGSFAVAALLYSLLPVIFGL